MSNTYMIRFAIFILSAVVPSTLIIANPLNPTSPTQITTSADLISQPAVCNPYGTSEYLVAWLNSDQIMTSLSFNNGSSWSSSGSIPISYPLNTVHLASGPMGTVAAWQTTALPGYGNYPTTSFSSNNGTSWTTPTVLPLETPANKFYGYFDILVVANEQGFLATYTGIYFTLANVPNAYASFSADGNTWSSPVQINPVNNIAEISTTIAVSGTTFLAAWVDNSGQAQTSISTDEGSTWSVTPVPISNATNVVSEVSLYATNAGFMAVWAIGSGDIYSSFSSNNGSTWTTNTTPFGNNIYGNIGLSGSTDGFIASWETNDNNIEAAFSSNQGSTWSTPIVISSNVQLISSEDAPGVAVTGNNCLFTWTDLDSNAYSSFSVLPPTITPRAFQRPSNRRP